MMPIFRHQQLAHWLARARSAPRLQLVRAVFAATYTYTSSARLLTPKRTLTAAFYISRWRKRLGHINIARMFVAP